MHLSFNKQSNEQKLTKVINKRYQYNIYHYFGNKDYLGDTSNTLHQIQRSSNLPSEILIKSKEKVEEKIKQGPANYSKVYNI